MILTKTQIQQKLNQIHEILDFADNYEIVINYEGKTISYCDWEDVDYTPKIKGFVQEEE